MASVFLSYDREDAARAASIAAALEKAGHSVWWDRHIKGGSQYSKEIEQALKAAEAVVVLWSERSVESAWVRDEAAAGRDSSRLVPVTLDRTGAPLGFRQYQAVDLSGWKGRRGSAPLARVVEAVEALVSGDGPVDGAPPAKMQIAKDGSLRRIAIVAAMILVVAAVGAAVFVWRPWTGEGVTLVSIGPGDGSPESTALARDLTVKLGSLAGESSAKMRLVAHDEPSLENPDLALEAASPSVGQTSRASLVLLDGKDRAILWSKDFEQPSSSRADLKQQIALTSARVLGCAMEGVQSGERLRSGTLKIYLNACAELADIGATDPRPVIPKLLAVIHDEPRFKPAWSKLLLAEAEASGVVFNQAEPNPHIDTTLREHISQARQLDPNMPEALLAEAELAPPRSISQATGLTERAFRQKPDDPVLLGYQADALLRVGRQREAVRLAERAAKLDPLSPASLGRYIQALAYSGRSEAAERELREAERLWSGTAALRSAQFRFHLRYGDPKVALAMEESDTPAGMMRMYLRTRMDPSQANVRRLFERISRIFARMENPSAGLGFAMQAYGEFGGVEELFNLLLPWRKPDDLGTLAEVFFRPQLRQFRSDPRFMQVAQRAGLLDYWRSSGKWPDFCFEADQPYDCKTEAAKLAARTG